MGTLNVKSGGGTDYFPVASLVSLLLIINGGSA